MKEFTKYWNETGYINGGVSDKEIARAAFYAGVESNRSKNKKWYHFFSK